MCKNHVPSYLITDNLNPVLYSSVRVYRNLADKRFVRYSSKEELQDIESIVGNVVSKYKEYKHIDLRQLNKYKLAQLRDTLVLAENKDIKHTQIYTHENKSIIVNLNEHITLQVVERGFNIANAYNKVKEEELKLSKYIDFAFDKELGYLTSTPKKIGCSMSMLVAISTPAFFKYSSNSLEKLINDTHKKGFTLNSYNGIMIIRNRFMIGLSEQDILEKIDGFVQYISDMEIKMSKRVYKYYRPKIEDKIIRASVILQNARMIKEREALRHLNWLYSGVMLGILAMDYKVIISLMFMIKDNQIQKYYNKEVKPKDTVDLKVYRADLIKDVLSKSFRSYS